MSERTSERILMREFQALSQEKWVNVEVSACNLMDSSGGANSHASSRVTKSPRGMSP